MDGYDAAVLTNTASGVWGVNREAAMHVEAMSTWGNPVTFNFAVNQVALEKPSLTKKSQRIYAFYTNKNIKIQFYNYS